MCFFFNKIKPNFFYLRGPKTLEFSFHKLKLYFNKLIIVKSKAIIRKVDSVDRNWQETK